MIHRNKAIFWDCDGTLMYSNESFLCALERALEVFAHSMEKSELRTFLKENCSWHNSEKPHPEQVGEAWWQALLDSLRIFCREHNIIDAEAEGICKTFRENVILYEYELYDDAEDILCYCKEQGYKNYLFSNNFPELVQVIERLGLDKYFEGYFLSANIGYEKPRIEAFQYAYETAGKPEICYMIGDNPVADIQGGQTIGLRTILVHGKAGIAEPDACFEELLEIKQVI